MTTTRSVSLVVALAVIGLTVAPLASGALGSPLAGAQADQSDTEATNASVGTLMQASATDTESTVESGMFDAAYENADNESRADIVRDRTTDLEAQFTALEAERAELRDQRENLSRGAYQSRMAKLTVEIASLERSIERTERRAAAVGVDESRLADLRGNATAIREQAAAKAGPGLAAVTRGLADTDGPRGVKAGPPDGQGDQPNDPGQGNGNGNQPPADPGPPEKEPNDGSGGAHSDGDETDE